MGKPDELTGWPTPSMPIPSGSSDHAAGTPASSLDCNTAMASTPGVRRILMTGTQVGIVTRVAQRPRPASLKVRLEPQETARRWCVRGVAGSQGPRCGQVQHPEIHHLGRGGSDSLRGPWRARWGGGCEINKPDVAGFAQQIPQVAGASADGGVSVQRDAGVWASWAGRSASPARGMLALRRAAGGWRSS